jgi:hypothetical protein
MYCGFRWTIDGRPGGTATGRIVTSSSGSKRRKLRLVRIGPESQDGQAEILGTESARQPGSNLEGTWKNAALRTGQACEAAAALDQEKITWDRAARLAATRFESSSHLAMLFAFCEGSGDFGLVI